METKGNGVMGRQGRMIPAYTIANSMGNLFRYQDTSGKKHEAVYIGETTHDRTPRNLKQRDCESLIINDPSGDGYRILSELMRQEKYIVRRLDFTKLSESHEWNCINAIWPETCSEDAHMLATTIVANLTEDAAIDSVFAKGQINLLKALLLYVALDPNRPPEQKTLCEVYDLLTNPNGEEFFDLAFSPTRLMKEQVPAIEPYLEYKSVASNLRVHILASMKEQLRFIREEGIRRVLSGNEIDLMLPGDQPCAYFCAFEKGDTASTILAASFYTMVMMCLIRSADGQPNGRTLMHVTLMLDDFPLYGVIPELEMYAMTLRKRNLGMSVAQEMVAVV